MERLMKLLLGFEYSLLFVLLGVYILSTNDTISGNVIGTSCVVFFGGLMIWALLKKTQDSKTK